MTEPTTAQRLKELGERLAGLEWAQAEPGPQWANDLVQRRIDQTRREITRLSVIREALSEPSLQAEVDRLRVALARIEHECIIRQPATAVQTVKDVRAIAREAIALSYCVYNPIGEK